MFVNVFMEYNVWSLNAKHNLQDKSYCDFFLEK